MTITKISVRSCGRHLVAISLLASAGQDVLAANDGAVSKALVGGMIDATEYRLPKAFSYEGLPSKSFDSYVFPSKASYENTGTVKQLWGEFYAVDKKLSAIGEKRPADFSALKFRTLIDARNAAASDLGEGIEYSDARFPADKQRQVQYLLTSIKIGLASPSGRDQVATRISYAGSSANVVLHYRTYVQSVEDAPSWSTYSGSQIMRVGTYQFRVTSTRAKAKTHLCLEKVVVMNDPTEKSICGGFEP